MGLQLGHVEYIMNTSKPTLQVQLIGTLTNTLKDFEWSHKALVQLPDSCQMQIACTQQYPVPNSMLLMPVVAIIVRFLVLSRLFQVIPSTYKQVLHVLHKIPSTHMATSLHHHIQW